MYLPLQRSSLHDNTLWLICTGWQLGCTTAALTIGVCPRVFNGTRCRNLQVCNVADWPCCQSMSHSGRVIAVILFHRLQTLVANMKVVLAPCFCGGASTLSKSRHDWGSPWHMSHTLFDFEVSLCSQRSACR